LKPRRNAASVVAYVSGWPAKKSPTTGTAGCCACAASGHAAALPRTERKSRRSILPPGVRPRLRLGAYHRAALRAVLCITAKIRAPGQLRVITREPRSEHGSSALPAKAEIRTGGLNFRSGP